MRKKKVDKMFPCYINQINNSTCPITVKGVQEFCVACKQFLKDAFARTLAAENDIEFYQTTELVKVLMSDPQLPW